MKATIKEINKVIKSHFANYLAKKMECFIYQNADQYILFNIALHEKFAKKRGEEIQIIVRDSTSKEIIQRTDLFTFLCTECEENQIYH